MFRWKFVDSDIHHQHSVSVICPHSANIMNQYLHTHRVSELSHDNTYVVYGPIPGRSSLARNGMFDSFRLAFGLKMLKIGI